VPPRVFSAVISTIFNRWTTARRFQQRDAVANRCVLGCAEGAEDSIEHYCRCPFTKQLGARWLGLDPSAQVNLHTFTLCNPHIATCEELVTSALLIYALYRATNHYRHSRDLLQPDVYNALRQWTREGALKHSNAVKILDNVWNPQRTLTPLPPMPAKLSPPTARLATKRALQTSPKPQPVPHKRARQVAVGRPTGATEVFTVRATIESDRSAVQGAWTGARQPTHPTHH
jgi:hypothetical protein